MQTALSDDTDQDKGFWDWRPCRQRSVMVLFKTRLLELEAMQTELSDGVDQDRVRQ